MKKWAMVLISLSLSTGLSQVGHTTPNESPPSRTPEMCQYDLASAAQDLDRILSRLELYQTILGSPNSVIHLYGSPQDLEIAQREALALKAQIEQQSENLNSLENQRRVQRLDTKVTRLTKIRSREDGHNYKAREILTSFGEDWELFPRMSETEKPR